MATNDDDDLVGISDCTVTSVTQQLKQLHNNGADISNLVANFMQTKELMGPRLRQQPPPSMPRP